MAGCADQVPKPHCFVASSACASRFKMAVLLVVQSVEKLARMMLGPPGSGRTRLGFVGCRRPLDRGCRPFAESQSAEREVWGLGGLAGARWLGDLGRGGPPAPSVVPRQPGTARLRAGLSPGGRMRCSCRVPGVAARVQARSTEAAKRALTRRLSLPGSRVLAFRHSRAGVPPLARSLAPRNAKG